MKLKRTIFTFCDQEVKRKNLLRMKLTAVFLLCFIVQSFAEAYSQGKINLDAENKAISEIFKDIEEQTGYIVVYGTTDLDPEAQMSVNIKNAAIDDVMVALLKQLGLRYTIVDEYIAISKIDEIELQEAVPAQVDTVKVKGKVIDYEGNALPGATIIEKGTMNGVTTDTDGNFVIALISGKAILQISYIGFETQEVEVGERSEINITLRELDESIQEVVVTGYQTISKERATGSFTKVGSEKLEQRVSNNIIDKLEGFSPGLNFKTDYATGRVDVQVRGISSMISPIVDPNATKPLYVVDGFPIEGDLLTINPEDVESVTLLKDASAASIWGVKASNGVIVITTKMAKGDEKLQIQVSSNMTISEDIDYSKMDWMNASDNLDMILEYEEKGWTNHQYNVSAGRPVSITDEAFIMHKGLAPNGDKWTNAQFDAYMNELRSRDATKDYEKYLFRRAFQATYNLSISGATEKNAFYSSLVFNDNLTNSIGNSNNRIVFNLRDNYKLNDKLTFTAGVNIAYRRANHNGITPSFVILRPPWETLVDKYGQTIPYYNGSFTLLNRWAAAEREEMTGISMHNNLLEDQRNSDNTSENFDVRSKFGIDLAITKDLKLNSSFQYEKGFYNQDEFNTMETSYMRLRVAHFYVDGQYHIPHGTEYVMNRSNTEAWNFRNTLTWDKLWDEHKLNVFAGTDIRKVYYENFFHRKFGYNKQTTTHVVVNEKDFASGAIKMFNGYRLWDKFFTAGNNDIREFSVFANMGYEYQGKYSLNASFRVDQKNLFGSDPKYRYKPLWSVGLGWNIQKEDFMQSVAWVNRLRLRATYGINGNASNRYSPYAQAENRNLSRGSYLYNYLTLTLPANPQLRWEETAVLNMAVDFALFNNKLNGSFDYYSRNSTDLIGQRELDPTNGFKTAWINYASMSNKGVELALNTAILTKNDLKWDATVNFSYNKNRVTKFDDRIYTATNLVYNGDLSVGRPFENLMSYNYAGLDEYGRVRTYDTNGNVKDYKAVVEVDELLYHGAAIAPFYGGINTKVFYKDFDLAVNLSYKFGHKFREFAYSPSFAYYGRQVPEYLNDRWQKPGDEANTSIPGIPWNGENPYSGEIERTWDLAMYGPYWSQGQDYVHNAGYIRIKDIILGYNMPKSISEKVYVKNLRFTAQVANPYLWTVNNRGLDPELNGYKSAWSNLKTFTFGIKVTF